MVNRGEDDSVNIIYTKWVFAGPNCLFRLISQIGTGNTCLGWERFLGESIMKYAVQAICALGLSIFGWVGTANAGQIDDPALFEVQGLTNTCPANCGSIVLGTDPISGITTVEYEFNSTITGVVAGDVKIDQFASSNLAALLRFENIGGSAVLFLFSANAGGSYPSDVGIPGSFQSDIVTISDNALGVSSLYTPTSTQPGFCLQVSGAACRTGVAYQLTSVVPEPQTLSLVVVGLVGAGAMYRRRKTVKKTA